MSATQSSAALSEASKQALAAGTWLQRVDTKTNKSYYVNPTTKQTTWDLDKELSKGGTTAVAPKTAQTNASGSAAAPTSSASSGATPAVATTSPGVAAVSASSPPYKSVAEALASGEWTERTDPKTNRKYFVNVKTKVTTWDLEKDLKAAAAAPQGTAAPVSTAQTNSGAAASAPATKTVQSVLASGEWQEKTDPKTGKKYYYNPKTKQTTWDLAKELGISESAIPWHNRGVCEGAAHPRRARNQGADEGGRLGKGMRLSGRAVLHTPRDG